MEGTSSLGKEAVVDIASYYHVLTEDETRKLCSNLEQVYARVVLLEVHTKKLRKRIAKRAKGNTQRLSILDDLSAKLEVSGTSLMTQEDLLGGSNQKDEFENSYLLTEMDSSGPESPSSALNTSGGFGRKRKALKSDALKLKEKALREAESD